MVVAQTFHEFRIDGIGSSDTSDLLGLDWGCPRRLAYEKQGTKPDHPFNGNGDTERGSALEPVAASEFEKRYGMPVLMAQPVIHPEFPILRCHPDGLIPGYDGFDGFGAAEIKCPSRENYYKITHSEPADAYKLQLQYVMGLMGAEWGKLIIFCADNWEMTVYDYHFDAAVYSYITTSAKEFWEHFVTHKLLPARLEPDDPRCRDCAYRTQCQGERLLFLLEAPEPSQALELPRKGDQLVARHFKAQAAVEKAEERLKKVDEELKQLLGDSFQARATQASISYRPQLRETIQGAQLAKLIAANALDARACLASAEFDSGFNQAEVRSILQTVARLPQVVRDRYTNQSASRPFKVTPLKENS